MVNGARRQLGVPMVGSLTWEESKTLLSIWAVRSPPPGLGPPGDCFRGPRTIHILSKVFPKVHRFTIGNLSFWALDNICLSEKDAKLVQ
jgi:hypothetical protein